MFWTNKIKVNLNSRWVSGGYPKLQQSPDRNMYCHLNTVIRNVKQFMSCQEGQCYFVPIHYERICHKLLCIIFAFCHSSHFRNTHVVKNNYTLYIYHHILLRPVMNGSEIMSCFLLKHWYLGYGRNDHLITSTICRKMQSGGRCMM